MTSAATETGGHLGCMIETLTLQALALQDRGNTAEALDWLTKALSLAEPEGYHRLFVDEGPPMAHLLYQAADLGIAPTYIGNLLAGLGDVEPAAPAPIPTPNRQRKAARGDLLSPREREALTLIAEGLSNKDIARQLHLAPTTIKAHSRNIYGKLDVHSRTQAVTKARSLGLVPPA